MIFARVVFLAVMIPRRPGMMRLTWGLFVAVCLRRRWHSTDRLQHDAADGGCEGQQQRSNQRKPTNRAACACGQGPSNRCLRGMTHGQKCVCLHWQPP